MKSTKAVKVSELKAHLSKYLRLASRGTRVVVHDRNEPVAELGPVRAADQGWADRMVSQGRLRRGTQDWAKRTITAPSGGIDIQASLRAVREDPNEVR
jgi:prevent-host-death family protein